MQIFLLDTVLHINYPPDLSTRKHTLYLAQCTFITNLPQTCSDLVWTVSLNSNHFYSVIHERNLRVVHSSSVLFYQSFFPPHIRLPCPTCFMNLPPAYLPASIFLGQSTMIPHLTIALVSYPSPPFHSFSPQSAFLTTANFLKHRTDHITSFRSFLLSLR